MLENIRQFFREHAMSIVAEIIIPIVVLSLIIGLFVRSCGVPEQVSKARQQIQIDSLNMQALRDSTRLVIRDAVARTETYERQAVQATMRADSLDRKLKQNSKARIEGTISVAPAVAVITGAPATVDAGDTLRAETTVYQRPFHITAAFVAPPSDSVRWTLGATIDPLRVGVRLACAAGPKGVHEARAELTVPDFAAVTLSDVQQDPGICTDPIKPPKPKRKLLCLVGGAGAAYAALKGQIDIAAGVGGLSFLFTC